LKAAETAGPALSAIFIMSCFVHQQSSTAPSIRGSGASKHPHCAFQQSTTDNREIKRARDEVVFLLAIFSGSFKGG